jgi:hypothetical protein
MIASELGDGPLHKENSGSKGGGITRKHFISKIGWLYHDTCIFHISFNFLLKLRLI